MISANPPSPPVKPRHRRNTATIPACLIANREQQLAPGCYGYRPAGSHDVSGARSPVWSTTAGTSNSDSEIRYSTLHYIRLDDSSILKKRFGGEPKTHICHRTCNRTIYVGHDDIILTQLVRYRGHQAKYVRR